MSSSGISTWSDCSTTGSTSTPAKLVWRRPWLSNGLIRTSRCVPCSTDKRAVRVGHLDLERRRLDAGLLGVGRVEHVDGVVVPLGPAQVHAQQHLGEVGGVDAAGLGPDRHQRLAGVVLAGQQGADLELVDRLAQRPATSASASARKSASSISSARSHSTCASSTRRRSSSTRRISPCTKDSREVTFCAFSGSSHRSGAEACSSSSAGLAAQRVEVDAPSRCWPGSRRVP